MTSSFLVPVYGAYALVSVPLVVWLARTLFKHARSSSIPCSRIIASPKQ